MASKAEPSAREKHEESRASREREIPGPGATVLDYQPRSSSLVRSEKDPRRSSPAAVMAMQRTMGNGAVSRLIAGSTAAGRAQALQLKTGAAGSAHPEPATPTNRTGLPDSLKSGVESLSGVSLDNVFVHYNSAEPAKLNALAHTQGSEIHVGPGQEQHLAHEAWHVVQQAEGRVSSPVQAKGAPVNDDARLELEADVMGAKAAAAGESGFVRGVEAEGPQLATAAGSQAGPLQLKPNDINTKTTIPLVNGEVQTPEGERERVSVATPINKVSGAGWAKPGVDLKGGHLYKREFGGADDYTNVVPWHADIEKDYTEKFEDVYSAGWKANGKGKGKSKGAESWDLTVQATFTETPASDVEQNLPTPAPPPGGKEDLAERKRFVDVTRWSIDTIPATAKASIEKVGDPTKKFEWTAEAPKPKTNIKVNDSKEALTAKYDSAHKLPDFEGPIDAESWFSNVEDKLSQGANH